MAFKLKSGNTTAFKQMGSSTAKQKKETDYAYALRKNLQNKGVFHNNWGRPGFNSITGRPSNNMGLPKNFNTSGKDSWVKRSKEILKKSKKVAKKGLKKGGGILGKRVTGVLGLLGAGTLNATATNPHTKKSEGEQIKNLLTKHKLKGGKK